MFLLIILFSMLYGGHDTNIASMEGVFSVSPNHVSFLIIPAEQFSEDILPRQEDSIYYTDMVVYNAVGFTSGGTFEYGIRLTIDEFAPYIGWEIVAIFWHSYDGSSPYGEVKVYEGDTQTQPDSVITTEPYTGADSAGFYRADLTNPVLIDGNDKWCTVEVTHPAGMYPASVDDDDPYYLYKSVWIYYGGNWYQLISISGHAYNWVMGAIVEAVGIEELTPGEEVITFGFAPMANPVRDNVTISYTTVLLGHVSIKVYDSAGTLVETLVNDVQAAETQTVNWNTTGIANGVYFVRLETKGNTDTHKLILVR